MTGYSIAFFMGIYIVSGLIYSVAVSKSLYLCPCVYVLSTFEVELHKRVHIPNILIDVD